MVQVVTSLSEVIFKGEFYLGIRKRSVCCYPLGFSAYCGCYFERDSAIKLFIGYIKAVDALSDLYVAVSRSLILVVYLTAVGSIIRMDHMRIRCIAIPITILGVVRILDILFNNIVNRSGNKTGYIEFLSMSEICGKAMPVFRDLKIMGSRNHILSQLIAVITFGEVDPDLKLE